MMTDDPSSLSSLCNSASVSPKRAAENYYSCGMDPPRVEELKFNADGTAMSKLGWTSIGGAPGNSSSNMLARMWVLRNLMRQKS